jgi:hypothetical protein
VDGYVVLLYHPSDFVIDDALRGILGRTSSLLISCCRGDEAL